MKEKLLNKVELIVTKVVSCKGIYVGCLFPTIFQSKSGRRRYCTSLAIKYLTDVQNCLIQRKGLRNLIIWLILQFSTVLSYNTGTLRFCSCWDKFLKHEGKRRNCSLISMIIIIISFKRWYFIISRHSHYISYYRSSQSRW